MQYLEDQQNILRRLYKFPNGGVTEVSTVGRTLYEVVRHVARVIHLESYVGFDVHARIEELAEAAEQ